MKLVNFSCWVNLSVLVCSLKYKLQPCPVCVLVHCGVGRFAEMKYCSVGNCKWFSHLERNFEQESFDQEVYTHWSNSNKFLWCEISLPLMSKDWQITCPSLLVGAGSDVQRALGCVQWLGCKTNLKWNDVQVLCGDISLEFVYMHCLCQMCLYTELCLLGVQQLMVNCLVFLCYDAVNCH